MLDLLIAKDVLQASPAARDAEAGFRTADPFPHVVIDGFFEARFCEKLIEQFPAFARGRNTNENGLPGKKATVEAIRELGDAYLQADELFRSTAFTEWIGRITGIDNLLYDPDYIGGGTHENLVDQELDPHVDFNYHPMRGWHRRLNLIVYLNPEWEETWGGALELHQNPWLPSDQNRVHRILPLSNRAVLFETSERSWHGFEAIKASREGAAISRKSLALYLYTTARPAAETAPSHSTVYVERPLPFVLRAGHSLTIAEHQRIARMLTRRRQHVERLAQRESRFADETVELFRRAFVAGTPLTADDVALLERAFSREDSLLKTLYDRETAFSADLEVLRGKTAKKRAAIPVFGPAALARSPDGYYPDQWAAPAMAVELVLRAPVETLTLRGHVHDVVPNGQILECAYDGEVHAQALPRGPFEWTLPLVRAAGARVVLRLSAAKSYNPAHDDGTTDNRELAYHLHGLELR